MDPASGLAQAVDRVRNKKNKVRYALFAFALFISVFLYRYVVNFFDPGNDIITQLRRMIVDESYSFYSGSEGGFYIQIGQTLENATRKHAPIVIANRKTLGGEENARRVMITPRSFGLVQEDTVRQKDFARDHIEFITPLYLERLHIIYDHDKYVKFVKSLHDAEGRPKHETDDSDQTPRRDLCPSCRQPKELEPRLYQALESTDLNLRNWLKQANISPGPVGSGRRLFAT